MIKNLIPPYTPGTGENNSEMIFCPSITTHDYLAPKKIKGGERQLCVRLTYHEAHEFVGQDTGADESHPQADVKFPRALRLHPHKQADKDKQV